jgi:CubicO group peptidase (beta-lactamase class C family)
MRGVTAHDGVRGDTAPGFGPVADALERLMRRGRGGGALVVQRGGETVVDLCTGSADAAGRRPWTPETLSISFSTTKGVASTVVHRLAERGLLGYDDPIAQHWPAFGAGGKERVTVRDLLTHRAGLSNVQAVAERAEDLLDHMLMEERLAARAVKAPTTRSGYHAITYGWIVAGLLRAITGRGMGELVDAELQQPLGITGLHIGAPEDAREQVAEPVGAALRQFGSAGQALMPVWSRSSRARAAFEALHVPGFHRLFEGAEPPIWTTEMPAVNGTFSARALAQLYGTIAGAEPALLSPETGPRGRPGAGAHRRRGPRAEDALAAGLPPGVRRRTRLVACLRPLRLRRLGRVGRPVARAVGRLRHEPDRLAEHPARRPHAHAPQPRRARVRRAHDPGARRVTTAASVPGHPRGGARGRRGARDAAPDRADPARPRRGGALPRRRRLQPLARARLPGHADAAARAHRARRPGRGRSRSRRSPASCAGSSSRSPRARSASC